MLRRTVLLLVVLLCSSIGMSQNMQVIHILKVRAAEETGTVKVNILNDLVDEMLLPKATIENSNKAKIYATEAAEMAENLNYDLGMSRSFEQLSLIYKTLDKLVLHLKWKAKAAKVPHGPVIKQQQVELNNQRLELAQMVVKLAHQNQELLQKKTALDSTVVKVQQLNSEKKVVVLENSLLQKEGRIKEIEVGRQRLKSQLLAAILGVFLILSGVLFILFRSRNKLAKELEVKNSVIKTEKKRSDELLLNILPIETANELKSTGKAEPKNYKSVSIMFTDFKDFTLIAEQLSPKELVNEIDYCFSAFDDIIAKHGIEKIKTIGDAYLCAYGINTTEQLDHGVMIQAAKEILVVMGEYRKERSKQGKEGFRIRIGIHTGPVVAGVVGKHKFAYDIWGDAVNTAARMEQSSEAGKINVSAETYELVKDKFNFVPRGKILAKNKGEMEMYYLESDV